MVGTVLTPLVECQGAKVNPESLVFVGFGTVELYIYSLM